MRSNGQAFTGSIRDSKKSSQVQASPSGNTGKIWKPEIQEPRKWDFRDRR
jgi:hypothetical protein